MAKVTYIGETPFIEAFGIKFIANEPKEIPDAEVPEKLKNNKFFEVKPEAKPPAAPKSKPEAKPPAAPEAPQHHENKS